MSTRPSAQNLRTDEIAIRDGLPAFFIAALQSMGRDPSHYKVYGGLGQLNFNRAKIPWVAICDRDVTTTTNAGYYIVLLFRQDMTGCYLSLNQGYTQFKRAYGVESIARRQIKRNAYACAEYLDPPAGFISGPIALAASHDMGRGYEQGAIVSTYYDWNAPALEVELAKDLATLLEFHDRLKARVGSVVLDFQPPAPEDDFQAAAATVAKKGNLTPPKDGPLQPPKQLTGGRTGRYRRDYNMAALALRAADFNCEVNAGHQSFTSRKTGRLFVEAHHLVPMSQQPDFEVSLDVPENIVALCPNCHRRLHHGVLSEMRPILSALFAKHRVGLEMRGIATSQANLHVRYGGELSDDD